MADAVDSKSTDSDIVGVQVPSPAVNGAILNQPTRLFFFKKVVAVVVMISR